MHAFLNVLLKDIAGSQANALHYRGQKANPSEDIIKHAVHSMKQMVNVTPPPRAWSTKEKQHMASFKS